MKKWYCIIALMLACFGVFAQGDTLIKKDTTKKLIGVSFEQIKKDLSKESPLYLLNGVELKDSISKKGFDELRSEDILDIDVLKPVDAVKIYGEKGKNGAVLISTNPGMPQPDPDGLPPPPPVAQGRDTVYKDALKLKARFVIDGEFSGANLKGINPADILSITVLKDDKASQYMESSNVNGTVLIITKTFAKKSCREKLGGHCKKYLEYLQGHQSSDEDFGYILNGLVLTGNSDEITKKLYEIPDGKIRSVKFMENTFRNGNKEKEIVVITTKRN